MPFRNTSGIVSTDGDPAIEADVIMTAAALGLAASCISETESPIQFDMDPLDVVKEPKKLALFQATVRGMDAAVGDYLAKKKLAPSEVKFGTSPGYTPGSIIMGVYKLAGQSAPQSVSEPKLSPAGKKLWEEIWDPKNLNQYTGRGAYSGFVDNHNTEGDTKPIGPLPTARFIAKAPAAAKPGDSHARWLPPQTPENELWKKRNRRGAAAPGDYVPWGLIGGEKAGNKVPDNIKDALGATNEADYVTASIKADKMEFVGGEPTQADIAMYTHGMIQAIYKGYHLGPSCVPYEIAVGDKTKKMASCLPCTLFMYANGYPPTSIHLGRGESWAPLYAPYTPSSTAKPTDAESAVIRDLNNAWYEKCLVYLKLGLEILDEEHITDEPHKTGRKHLKEYLDRNESDKTVGGTLILDAITVHEGELERISRTLKLPSEALTPNLEEELLSEALPNGVSN